MFTLLVLLILLYFHVPIGWWIFIVWAIEMFLLGRWYIGRRM